VAGQVLDAKGSAVAGVRVELLVALPDGGFTTYTRHSAVSNRDGRFHIEAAPGGEIILGVNIDSAPSLSMPYPPTYFPGVQDVKRARRLPLRPHGKLQGLTIRLPQPMARREVTVTFTGKEKDQIRKVEASARNSERYAGGKAAGGDRVVLDLLEGIEYEIYGKAIVSAEGHFRRASSIVLPAGRGPAEVVLRLED
jgi:hypothetical protein